MGREAVYNWNVSTTTQDVKITRHYTSNETSVCSVKRETK